MFNNVKVWKITTLFLILICLFQFYAQLNIAVTLDHSIQAFKEVEDSNVILVKLLNLKMKDSNKEEVINFLKVNFDASHLIKQDEKHEVSLNNIIFKFKDDKLQSVTNLN